MQTYSLSTHNINLFLCSSVHVFNGPINRACTIFPFLSSWYITRVLTGKCFSSPQNAMTLATVHILYLPRFGSPQSNSVYRASNLMSLDIDTQLLSISNVSILSILCSRITKYFPSDSCGATILSSVNFQKHIVAVSVHLYILCLNKLMKCLKDFKKLHFNMHISTWVDFTKLKFSVSAWTGFQKKEL